MKWDEPKDCTTPRGWLHLTKREHPDRDDRCFEFFLPTCCGNYLEYYRSRGPNGEAIHATAYVFRIGVSYVSSTPLGAQWFATIDEAKRWIERTVKGFLNK